ncbi:Clavaminate synthase-like protein [Polychaeton citri CBS 116435]|uniref:Clavaminate synthase-like protein n=1 Tax=Polychaeton citri CBS 116435 TaxID=1314669 RepID=A0A9P4QJA0_9PEZI|nr:Clavaminate synthase-like protein [Polychaeton citri CBS 116435]
MHLQHLAEELEQCIIHTLQQNIDDSDEIFKCGKAPLAIIQQRPNEVLQLAHSKLHTWPYRDVPVCWRRLYEDASIWKAAAVLKSCPEIDIEWIDQIAHILDMATAMSGAPKRAALLTLLFELIYKHTKTSTIDAPTTFHIEIPQPLDSTRPVDRTTAPLDFEAFQSHISKTGTPLIMPDAVSDWPAYTKWCNPRYLLETTLNGRRLVPVEVGSSYTDEAWGQRVIPFSEYLHTYLLNQAPPDVGYLAQYDLFAQIPKLRNDILTPEYCFISPRAPRDPPRNASEAKALDMEPLEEPLVNAWLGPKGTKSPMHTDPYHNILCQVVGSKYIRLYSPNETSRLYPRGNDDAGVDMSNTSKVEIGHVRELYDRQELSSIRTEDGRGELSSDLADFELRFPDFKEAVYQECILGPGECLYIPLGWWHYVESLSTSFSVSFWWN